MKTLFALIVLAHIIWFGAAFILAAGCALLASVVLESQTGGGITGKGLLIWFACVVISVLMFSVGLDVVEANKEWIKHVYDQT